MSSNSNLPQGAFFTNIGGKRCTAIPKNSGGNNGNTRGGTRGGGNTGGRTSAAPSRTRARNTSVASISTTHSPSSLPPAQTTLSTTTTTPPPPPPAPTETPSTSTPEPARSTPASEVPPPALAAPAPASSSDSSSVAPVTTTPAASTTQPTPVQSQPTPSQPAPAQEGATDGGAGSGAGSGSGTGNGTGTGTGNGTGTGTGTGGEAAASQPAAQSTPPAAAPAASSESTPIASFSVIGDGVGTSAVSSALPPAQPAQSPSPEADLKDPAATTASLQPSSTSAPAADATSTPAAPGTSPLPIAAEPTPSSSPGATPAITTIGTAQPTDSGATNSGSGTGTGSGAGAGINNNNNPTVSAVPASGNDGDGNKMTVAVAGGVVGGVILISLIAFLIWFLRKRQLKKRRSTLLTPLSTGTGPGFPADKSYVINRGSIGPTARTEKLKASVAYGIGKVKERVNSFVSRGNGSSGGVNMNRGNSQFMENTSPTLSRSNSIASRHADGGVKGWWGGVAAAGMFKRNKKEDTGDPFGSVQEKKAPMTAGNVTAQPDFLTLLGMDDRELQREAQRKRASRNGSASSTDHFLGNLGLSFNNSNGGGDDPFADSNSLPHQSAKPAPLKPGGSSGNSDPFSDANQIPAAAATKPSTYVENVRSSRGSSIGRLDSFYQRESVNSVESFETRRNKFRSDPFDLERPELLGRSQGSNNFGMLGGDVPRLSSAIPGIAIKPPRSVHQRSESFTSKYSSGVSLGDWSDPGPDIGPGSSRQDLPEMLREESPTQGINSRRSPSNASTGVGKAM